MEAATAAAVSGREIAMAFSWAEAMQSFASKELRRAEGFYGYFRRLDAMTDLEYDQACNCDEAGCPCNS